MTFFGPDLRNGLPIGLGSVAGFGIAPRFSPASLFAGGVQGAWYDPSDPTTLFSDRAGTTPCGTPGGGSVVPVGAMLDERAPGYSVYFDGTGDWLGLTSGIPVPATGPFTIEAWIYAASATDRVIWTQYSAGTVGRSSFRVVSNKLVFANASAATVTSTASISLNTWTHVAVTRDSSNNLRLFIGGNLDTTSASYTASIQQIAATIGAYSDGTDSFSGYISNLRITNTAVYTGNFTPPTAPLTAITGTSLLTCGTSWTGNPAITKNGDARVDGLNPFTASPVGNHAIAANDTTARPELSARVNLLTYSEQFSNAIYTAGSVYCTDNTATSPIGNQTAATFLAATGSANNYIYQTLSPTFAAATDAKLSWRVKANTLNFVGLTISNDTLTDWVAATFDLTNPTVASKTDKGASGTYVSSSISSLGNGWYEISITGRLTGAIKYAQIQLMPSATPTYGNYGNVAAWAAGSNKSIYIWGADFRPANIGTTIPAYQRVADQYTYDNVGFPRYLAFNGTNRAMSTPANVNLSGTDKATVFAGVRKQAAGLGFVAELSSNASTNNGSFYVVADNGTNDYGMSARGTSQGAYKPQTYTAPISNVLTASYDIAGATLATEIVPRVNGAVVQTDPTGSCGTGNFGSYPLFIGSRNNASFFLNGNIYSLIVVGSAVSAGNITSTETWVAGKTGITI